MFNGIVVDPTATLWEKGEFAECLDYKDFELYTPTPQELAEWGETETLTNNNPKYDTMHDKDINLRLECLKLAIEHTETNVIECAELFYEWISEKP